MRLPRIERHGLNAAPDGGDPLFVNAVHAVHQAIHRGNGARGAVGVLTEAHRCENRVIKAACALDQRIGHNEQVGGHVPAHLALLVARGLILGGDVVPFDVADPVVQHHLAGFPAVQARVCAGRAVAHRACNRAILRNVGKADLDQLADIGFEEAGRFHRRDKHFGVNALAVAVIHHRVLEGILRGLFRMAGEEAGPDFRTYEGAAGILEVVVVRAADRRLKPGAQIGLGCAVFAVGENHQFVEILPQHLAVDVQALVLQRQQPQHLDVQIVVGQRFARHLVGIVGHIVGLAVPFHRHAQRAADVFADPAAQHPAAVILKRKIHIAHPP